jgi:hypothetical protein
MRRRRLRPFRLGLWAGVVAGAAWFVQRYQRSRREVEAVGAGGWSVVEPAPETPSPRLAAERIPDVPVVPVVEPEVVEVGDLPQPPAEPPIEAVAEAEPVPATKPAAKKAAAKKAAPAQVTAAWVVPEPGGLCPTTHPVKAKLSSKLFHLPGMFAYTRTNPDRCYRDGAAAEADGLRKAKR